MVSTGHNVIHNLDDGCNKYGDSDFIRDFGEFLEQTVTIETWLSNDGFVDIYSAGVDYPCALEFENVQIKKPDGSLDVSSMQIYIDGSVSINLRDHITINGNSPKILRIDTDYGAERPWKVYGKIVFT